MHVCKRNLDFFGINLLEEQASFTIRPIKVYYVP